MQKIFILLGVMFTSTYLHGETILSGIRAEALCEAFEEQMKKGKNNPSDVINFISQLEEENRDAIKKKKGHDLETIISTLKYIDYSQFDAKKCKAYKRTIIARSWSPAFEVIDDNMDTDTYHALKVLSLVCKDPNILKVDLNPGM